MITHIVLFKLKDRSKVNREEAAVALRSLKYKIDVLKSLEIGIDVVRAERSYDLALTATFNSLEDLEAYQVHPEHVKVGDYIKRASETIAAVDYES